MELNTLIISLVMLGLSFHSIKATAWEQVTCKLPLNIGKKKHWMVKQYKPVIDPVTIPLVSAQYTALTNAIARMNLNPSSVRYVSGGLDNRDGIGLFNNESEIWFADLPMVFPLDGPTTIAVEKSDSDLSPTCTATESDIRINTKYRLARAPVGSNKIQYNLLAKNQLFEYGGSYENFTSTVMHEMGHSAGLDHEGDVMGLMGEDNLIVTNGNVFNPYIGEDTAGGLIALYPPSPTTAKEDVGVSHWRYGQARAVGDGTFYSVHYRTRIFNTAGVELLKVCSYTKPNSDGSPIILCP